VLEGDVEESAAGLREDVAALVVVELGVDVETPSAAPRQPRAEPERAVDRDGPAVADEDPRRHGREPVPRREEAARLVERGSNESAVDDPGAGLVARPEREDGLVALDALLAWMRQADAVGVVAATPAERVVVRRNARYRMPPRSKCAR
jgi:hypothetical protein